MAAYGAMVPRARNSPVGLSMLWTSLVKDQKLLASLAVAFTGIGIYTTRQISSKEVREQVRLWYHPEMKKAASKKLGDASDQPTRIKKSSGAAIDERFFKRLSLILRILLPSWHCKEVLLLLTQCSVLVARSLLSLRVARLGGDGLKAVLDRNSKKFYIVLADFFVTGLAASVINSALKYLTNSITISFRQRLTRYVHNMYMVDHSYYKAAVLRVGNLDNADQRIVEDLNQFCGTAADLFARTFKPALDVTLASYRMSTNMGWKGLTLLYTYFLASGLVVRRLSPPFAKYIGEIAKREVLK
jgi:ATP-binding cassette subfamily D (ALD) protein 3